MKYLPEGEVWEKGVSIDRLWIDAFFTEHVVTCVQVIFCPVSFFVSFLCFVFPPFLC